MNDENHELKSTTPVIASAIPLIYRDIFGREAIQRNNLSIPALDCFAL